MATALGAAFIGGSAAVVAAFISGAFTASGDEGEGSPTPTPHADTTAEPSPTPTALSRQATSDDATGPLDGSYTVRLR
ncbi:hypothetical protein [Streptomyces radicis]|uniref:Serine/threonine protein kinase n=1 Tax=Streptomyces radicis TaxID=1750517 RepID=A0A3A9W3K6_9ACTN|nr:hypothetical protein [Streptomyces radicis]RKN07430.1 hypothetical protein D7319_18970 [Streptomyces radicis]RKN19551.1 hypothetical protein D7318_19555 [Streptomyces radicis]